MRNIDHPLFLRWQAIKSRCNNRNHISYHNYGGKGITICEKWSKRRLGFLNFLEDMGDCPPGYTLDRIDVNKGYYPGNCRWASLSEQQINRTRSASKCIEVLPSGNFRVTVTRDNVKRNSKVLSTTDEAQELLNLIEECL